MLNSFGVDNRRDNPVGGVEIIVDDRVLVRYSRAQFVARRPDPGPESIPGLGLASGQALH